MNLLDYVKDWTFGYWNWVAVRVLYHPSYHLVGVQFKFGQDNIGEASPCYSDREVYEDWIVFDHYDVFDENSLLFEIQAAHRSPGPDIVAIDYEHNIVWLDGLSAYAPILIGADILIDPLTAEERAEDTHAYENLFEKVPPIIITRDKMLIVNPDYIPFPQGRLFD